MGAVAEYWTRDRQGAGSTLIQSTANDLEQAAKLRYAHANSAYYPQRNGKLVVLTWQGLWGEHLVWLIGAVVCLLGAPRVQLSVSTGNGWPHNALRYH